MSETPTYPYVTVMEPRFAPLETVDAGAVADACTHRWYNETLCEVNDAFVRMAVVVGEYHWHAHDGDDEFFFVVEGHLSIDLEDRVIELGPRQGVVIPKGVRHRPRAATRTVMLMVETKAIVPTGS